MRGLALEQFPVQKFPLIGQRQPHFEVHRKERIVFGSRRTNARFPEGRGAALFIDGILSGSPAGYSYIDANGILQTVSYTADDQNGFRVSASNLPQPPKDELQTIQDTAEVAAAKRNHIEELQKSQQANWQDQNLLSYKILPSYYSLAQIQQDGENGKTELSSNAAEVRLSRSNVCGR